MSPKIIAEVGCNHCGKLDTALELIKIAALFCKVDVVKFQKRTPRELLSYEEYAAPHPNPAQAYGPSYGEHRERLEFSLKQHKRLQEACYEWGVDYSTSVWDLTSAKEIVSLQPKLIKVPSACNLNFELLGYLLKEYEGEIHLSIGMTARDEEDQIAEFFAQYDRLKDLVVYSCTSGYPIDFEDICLNEITRLRGKFEGHVKAIGFSGHHLGIAADVGALALGATWFERHYTLDRTWKGTDHAASLEPDGLRRLTRDLNNVSKALTYKSEPILPVEEIQRNKLKRL